MKDAKKGSVAGPTGITATFVARRVNNKQGSKNFGKKFYVYDLTGPKAAIKAFLEHPDSVEYGVHYAADGVTPQYACGWRETFAVVGSTYDVNMSIYGTYVLDKTEANNTDDTMELLEERGMSNAARVYAEVLIGSKLGLGLNKAAVARLAEVTSDGTDATLAEG